jgi:uncharacterized protein (TIRG00374 family)
MFPPWLRHGAVIFVVLAVIEYLVVPELVGAGKDIDLLAKLNLWWVAAGILLECGSILGYALLARSLLPGHRPSLSKLIRMVLSTTGIAHVIPGGAVGGAGLGYRLLTVNGVDGPDAGFVLATEAIGSAIILNILLWLALLISIPLTGLQAIYVIAALVGLLVLLAAGSLVYAFTKGEERTVGFIRAIGRRVPRVGPDHLERLLRQVGDSVARVVVDRGMLGRATLWASLNWLLDAASLWSFLAALGHVVDPAELFVAYAIANVLGSIPLTPGGLGVIEASAVALLVGFGSTRNVATLGVIGWRLVNFWLPIPAGAAAYISLRLPRGSGLGAHRRALGDMAVEAKQAGVEP